MTTTRHTDALRLQSVADETEAAIRPGDLSNPVEAVNRIVGPLIDPDSVRAMAIERTDPIVALHPELILFAPDAVLRSVWMDAFTLGVLFQQRGGHVD